MLSSFIRKSMSTSNQMLKYAAGTQPFTVLVEGNIASGKTSFLKHFESYKDDICLMTEPVDKWRNVKGNNLLDLMYRSPDRWASPFQSYVTLTMLQSHTSLTDKRIKLMERSIYSARYVFAKNMLKTGMLDEGMYRVLEEWFEFLDKSVHIQCDLIVYLRTTPEVVYQRMRARARAEEETVSLQYLTDLHELHDDWLMRNRHGNQTRVLVLDATRDLDSIVSEYTRFENIIKPALQPHPAEKVAA